MLRKIVVGATLGVCLCLVPALPAGAEPKREVPPELPDATGKCVSGAALIKVGGPEQPGMLGSFPFLDECTRPPGRRA